MKKIKLSDKIKEEKKIEGISPDNLSNIEDIKIDEEFIRDNCNIFFATPCYGGLITDQYFLSMFKTTQELIRAKINYRVTTLRNESLVTRARNILTAMFLQSGASHLFFIDADIEWEW